MLPINYFSPTNHFNIYFSILLAPSTSYMSAQQSPFLTSKSFIGLVFAAGVVLPKTLLDCPNDDVVPNRLIVDCLQLQ